MKAINVSSKSRWFSRPWHVQLAGAYGLSTVDRVNDRLKTGISVCSYFWQVILGLVMAVFYVAVTTWLLVIPLADFCAWVAAGLMTSFVTPDSHAKFFIVLLLSLQVLLIASGVVVSAIYAARGALFVIGGISKTTANHRSSDGEPSAAIMQAYRAVRDKTCVLIKYKRDTPP